ncbi:unnamed protein product [Microthlaspi erraticum]|uniref:PORR domain-containing protein n=1 Tax=Microthlaspi erraticum TaxID=1685480 RepID=A0A6D2IWR2_9BRAS|nr:unnamed protein product [Microthlaspi erraticum]
MMALTQLLPSSPEKLFFLSSFFLPSLPPEIRRCNLVTKTSSKKFRSLSLDVSCSAHKIVRSPSLDKHVVKQYRVRFVQKLKTLLLSKPKHFIPIQILYKCRSYLCIENPRTIVSMIRRYPTIFELFTTPTPHLPINATKPLSQLCVRMTSAASSLAMQELNLKSEISDKLATKLQKLLMLSSHRRLLLSKLVHIGPDFGFPPNFRSRLCNDYPDKFKTVDTSYGRALELVSWDPELAKQMPSPEVDRRLIVDRPLKFKRLNLRKGLNLKRRHQDYLIRFRDSPDVCPYNTSTECLASESIEAEKRACAVVREVLGLTVEKRTLIDHLTHFRNEFGLPNKLRSLVVRHPELFYVSIKGTRDSVFLVEAYNDSGDLVEKDETSVIRERLLDLVQEGKRLRRERRRKGAILGDKSMKEKRQDDDNSDGEISDLDDEYEDGFENLFDSEDSGVEYHFDEEDGDEAWVSSGETVEYWSRKLSSSASDSNNDETKSVIESW